MLQQVAIKQRLYNIGIWWHSQNLSKISNRYTGSKWRHGRGWLHLDHLATNLGLEWLFFRKSNNFRITLYLNDRGEHEVVLSIGLPYLFGLYFTIENHHLLRKILPGKWEDSMIRPGQRFWMPVDRKIGVSVHDGNIWFSLWENPMEWSRSDPWWWQFSLDIPDLIFGKSQYTTEILEEGESELHFREGSYAIVFKKELCAWKRPRWFKKQIIRYDLDMPKPIPVPGKGENSWDIDDDAIFSMTTAARTLPEALGNLNHSVLRRRFNYGGRNWVPE